MAGRSKIWAETVLVPTRLRFQVELDGSVVVCLPQTIRSEVLQSGKTKDEAIKNLNDYLLERLGDNA
jgi:hypothetical protein